MNTGKGCLPDGITVLERGWLSANHIVLHGGVTTVVDTGYHSHSEQMLLLVERALRGEPLQRLVNTHLHSDHCGGNAALQARYPQAQTLAPPGLAELVRVWDAHGLSYTPTGQHCPPFRLDATLPVGSSLQLGQRHWQVHAAPGHDPHSVILFEPIDRVLISADALWENGFGVVFPAIDGLDGFADVAATLDRIERLAPRTVIPGHGRVFHDAGRALATARRRLDSFLADPDRHALHAAKVLLKFKLLEWRRIRLPDLIEWATGTEFFQALHRRHFADLPMRQWTEHLLVGLAASGAAEVDAEGWVHNL